MDKGVTVRELARRFSVSRANILNVCRQVANGPMIIKDHMQVARPPIPFADYQRIFRIIKTVLDGADANTAHACIFFSVAGAYLIEKFYKKKCQPVAGAALYAVDDSNDTVLAFAKREGGYLSSARDAFHCWIQCDDYIIDFMAPLFRESLQAKGFKGDCSRRMFQKSLHAMAPSPDDLCRPGDFYLEPNKALTLETLERFFSRNDTGDLVNVCEHWYKKPPKSIDRQLSMADNYGVTMNMRLSDLTVVGAW